MAIRTSNFEITKAYSQGANVAAIYSCGEKVWPTDQPQTYHIRGTSTAESETILLRFVGDTNVVHTETVNVTDGAFDYSYTEPLSGLYFNASTTLTSVDLSSSDGLDGLTYMGADWYPKPGMFSDCTALVNIDFTNVTLRNITTLQNAFSNCSLLEEIDMPNATLDKVTNMGFYFTLWVRSCNACKYISLPQATFADLTDATGLATGLINLESISIPIATFDKVTSTGNNPNYNGAFNYCQNLTTINLQSATFANATTTQAMFKNCIVLSNLNMPNANFDKVTDATQMFYYCKALDSSIIANQSFSSLKYSSSMFNTAMTGELTLTGTFDNILTCGTQNAGMFQGCGASIISLPNATFANATQCYCMFNRASADEIFLPNATFGSWNGNASSPYLGFMQGTKATRIVLTSATFESLVGAGYFFSGNTNLQSLSIPSATFANNENTNNMFTNNISLADFVCGENSVKKTFTMQWCPLTYQSMLNVCNWLATVETAQTLTLKNVTWNALTTDQQNTLTTIATAKNWTIATA